MSRRYNILIFGASYGSLLASKLLMAGHTVTLICTPGTAKLINEKGTLVKLPARGVEGLIDLDSNEIARRVEGASLAAASPAEVDPADFDLVVLGMQEPQYSSPEVAALLRKVAAAKVPSMAIMNMPPLPFLRRIPGLDIEPLLECFTEPSLWDGFDPGLVTLASPDPQAFRPEGADKNVLQVSLPTNFKVAAFEQPAHTQMLSDIEEGISSATWDVPGHGDTALPVKVKLFDSLFVPLAKWSMLLTGNYRCVLDNDVRAIRDAVHGDQALSESVYQWVVSVCETLGADATDMVPFVKYAKAAEGLVKPSSAARALASGATGIERVDLLVRNIARQHGLSNDNVDQTVGYVNAFLEKNKRSSKAS